MAIGFFQKNIDATDTPQVLSATSIKVAKVFIQAKRGNAGSVFIGDSTIDSGDVKGFELNIPQTNVFLFPFILESKGGQNEIDLADIYIAGTQNDDVNVVYWIF